MRDRLDMAKDFAANAGCDVASMIMIAGDASHRKYYRANRAGRSTIVMDAPPDKGEDVRPFVRIAQYLTGCGLSAPEILAEDPVNGFLLLEDLGDDLFARLIERNAADEGTLYTAAVDVLLHLHRQTPPALKAYDAPTMADAAALSVDWYARGSDRGPVYAAMKDRLAGIGAGQLVLIQRDYHAENLLWLPERTGTARVGLLDFQDAMIGHPAYDLVSVLQDARRDVPPTLESAMIAHYVNNSTVDESDFRKAYHLLGVQRNLRIVGVFARLWLRDGRPRYVDLIPRVWGLIQRNLDTLEDQALTQVISSNLPKPTDQVLDQIRQARE